MIGRCSSCGSYGEIELIPVPNGAQRTMCHACTAGPSVRRLPTPRRFRLLVDRLQRGSIASGETRELRVALTAIESAPGAAEKNRLEAVRVLFEELAIVE
jgi:hypothetical protein